MVSEPGRVPQSGPGRLGRRVAEETIELSNAERAMVAYAEAMSIPVATTPFGKGVFDARHRLSLGAPGRNGPYAANAACRNADVILALGTQFDDRATSAWRPGLTYRIPPTRLIHVDIDPAEIGRNFQPASGIIADARLALEQLMSHRTDGAVGREAWLERIDGWRAKWDEATKPPRTSDAVPIRPERVVADVRRVVPEDGIVLVDVGAHHNWMVAEYETWKTRTLIQTWGAGRARRSRRSAARDRERGSSSVARAGSELRLGAGLTGSACNSRRRASCYRIRSMTKKSDRRPRSKRRAKRLSATEASRSFARLLDEVEAGVQFVVHRRGKDVCLMSAPPLPGRTAAQALEILRGRLPVRLDGRFGEDLLAIIAAESTDRSSWDS